MELLEKLLKERGTGVSDKVSGVLKKGKSYESAKKKGKSYESFIDKKTGEFKRTDPSYTPREMQTIDPLANTPAYNNATTNALSQMRGLVPGVGAVSGNEYDFMEDGKSVGYNFTGDGVSERDLAELRRREGIQANLGGGMDRGAVSDQVNRGAVSNVDQMFAQALNTLSPREQAEIVQTTQGYNDEQVENFKRQYLQGRVSSYELERPYLQSNLGFQ